MKMKFSLCFLLGFGLLFSRSFVFDLQRQRTTIEDVDGWGNITFSPYVMNMTIEFEFEEGHAGNIQKSHEFQVAIDSTSKFFVLFCCADAQNRANCVNLTTCTHSCRRIEDGDCCRFYRYYTVFEKDVTTEQSVKIYGIAESQTFINTTSIVSGGVEFVDAFDPDYRSVEVAFASEIIHNMTQGIFGFSYSFLNNSFDKFWKEKVPDGERWIGLDFFVDLSDLGNELGEGRMVVGKTDVESYRATQFPGKEIVWAEKDYTVNDLYLDEYYYKTSLSDPEVTSKLSSEFYTLYHQFEIYDLRICDRTVLDLYGTSWRVIVDTNIEGIALPKQFLQTFQSWINWDRANESFPLMSFRLEDSENGIPFEFPLELLFDNETNYFHLHNYNDVRTALYELTYDGDPSIRFGTRVLKYFFTVLDTDNHRVGLLKKNGNQLNRTLYCAAPAVCYEHQDFDDTSNTCAEPECDGYIFQYSEVDGICVYRYDYMTFVVIVILTFVCVDFLIDLVYSIFVIWVFKRFKNNPIYG